MNRLKTGIYGKPIYKKIIYEKRFENKRVFFIVFEKYTIILFCTISDKNTQQKIINKMKEQIEYYFEIIERIYSKQE
jgi:hypothetical protein